MDIIEAADFEQDGLVFIDSKGAVWQTFCAPWWDLFAQLRWVLTPGKRVWMQLRTSHGKLIRVQAAKIAPRYVVMGR